MSPEQLTSYLTDLTAAAEVVEAIDDADLQRRRGWDLTRWRYDLVPWGVRFSYRGRRSEDQAEVLAVIQIGDRIREVLTRRCGGDARTVVRVG